MGVGYDNLDLAAWGALGVPVCNVPDYGTTEVADHAIALMLSLVRGTAHYAPAIVADPVRGWDYSAAPLVRRSALRRQGPITVPMAKPAAIIPIRLIYPRRQLAAAG